MRLFLRTEKSIVVILLIAALVLSLFLASPATSGEPPSQNTPDFIWWEHVHFVPKDKSIRGIPVGQIDPSWTSASELTKPKSVIARFGRDVMKEYGISFSRSGDFNKDGIEDLLVVGIYRNRKGKQGNFVLVLSKNARGKWYKTSMFSSSMEPRFQAIAVRNDRVWIWGCIDCDWVQELVWDEASQSYALDPPSTGEENK